MLVLSRKKNESIVIGDSITIVVVETRGDKVRLGVEAPKEVPVHRREVFDAIRRNEAAAKAKEEIAAPEAEDEIAAPEAEDEIVAPEAEDEIVARSKLWDEFAEKTRELDNKLHSLAAEPGSFERLLRDVTGSELTSAEFDYIAQSAAEVVASTQHFERIQPVKQDCMEACDES